jgi:hypothetical protein
MTPVAETSYAPDGKPRHVAFDTQPTRYIQIELLESHGLNAIIAEVAVGGTKRKPRKK